MRKFINVHTHHAPDEGELGIRNWKLGDAFLEDSNHYYSVGIHPWFINKEAWREELKELELISKKNSILAIGEAGLDKLISTPMSLQQEVFEAMILLSESVQKPLIIHCVRAFEEVLSIHKRMNPSQRWILHGFNRNVHLATPFIERNFIFSFGQDLLKMESPSQEVLRKLSVADFFLESDDQMIPMPVLYAKAAEIRAVETEVLKESLFDNFKKIFNYARA